MNKLNKVLFGFGTVAAVVAPVAAVVACDKDTPAKGTPAKDTTKNESNVLTADAAKALATAHTTMWTAVEWKEADHTKGLKYITGKTATDAKPLVNAFFKEINKLSSEIKWDKVKTLINDETKFNADKKLITETVAALDAAKVNAASEDDLLTLAYKTNVLYQNYLPLIAISFGKDSASAQDFLITILKGHTSNNLEVDNKAEYVTYVEKAKETLEAKIAILSAIK